VQLHRDREEFEAAGVELVVIGQGTPRHAEAFLEDQGVDGLRLLVDPDRKTYRAIGARVARPSQLFGPQVALKAARAVASERVIQGKTIGHPAQLGGVLVVAPGGDVVWSHLASDAGDNPPNSEVLEAAREAAAAA
jgi:AhpC/TSA antioxidant enzyme